ncbi:MAG: alpha/beta fold hydrolase [Bacillota bacterium]
MTPTIGLNEKGVALRQTLIAGTPAYLLTPENEKGPAVILHGYGGVKEEVLGLGFALAGAGWKAYLPDLPGHGAHPEPLSAKSVRKFVAALKTFAFRAAIGHSLGGRIAMALGTGRLCLLSVPLDARFDGRKSDLLRVLRARRVREAKPFNGLEEALAALNEPWPAPPVLLFHSFRDLPACLAAVARAREIGWETRSVNNVGHLDIVTAPEVIAAVGAYFS